MSQKSSYNIRCPKCDHAFEVDLYDAVNVEESPELKDDLLANRLNCVECKDCGFSYRVDKRLLYHDPTHKIMIYLMPGQDFSGNELQRTLHELSRTMPSGFETPEIHLVLSRTELVERIFLIEAGLDERIIEYIKYLVYSKNLQKINPETKALLFDAEDSNEVTLVFVIQDVPSRKLEGMLNYDRDTYEALNDMFDRDDKTANLYELFPGPYISARALILQDSVDTGNTRR